MHVFWICVVFPRYSVVAHPNRDFGHPLFSVTDEQRLGHVENVKFLIGLGCNRELLEQREAELRTPCTRQRVRLLDQTGLFLVVHVDAENQTVDVVSLVGAHHLVENVPFVCIRTLEGGFDSEEKSDTGQLPMEN
jgi:hypothetical protein